MAVSTIERRRAALFAALAEDGRGTLIADRLTYLVTTAPAALVASLTQPFGAGTTFEVVGAVPSQLALGAGGRIVAGAVPATIGSRYEIKVRANSADGRRSTTETLAFVAMPESPVRILNSQGGFLRNASGGYIFRSNA